MVQRPPTSASETWTRRKELADSEKKTRKKPPPRNGEEAIEKEDRVRQPYPSLPEDSGRKKKIRKTQGGKTKRGF